MIPKKIHYCWFGGKELPELAEKCIASWEKFCPDYEIVRWDESNFDLDRIPYARWCYDHGKWAFLSDYVRLAVVAEQGGAKSVTQKWWGGRLSVPLPFQKEAHHALR